LSQWLNPHLTGQKLKMTQVNQPSFDSVRCIQTFTGHSNSVNSIAMSPDGQILASGSRDGTIKLWHIQDGKEIYTLKDQPTNNHPSFYYPSIQPVYSVAFSPDGKILASGSGYKTITLWKVKSGKKLGVLKGHMQSVRSVAFSSDGEILASGSEDRTIKLWQVQERITIDTLTGHKNTVNSVAFSPDGKSLVSGSSDGNIKLWCGERNCESTIQTWQPSSEQRMLLTSSLRHNLWNKDVKTVCTTGHGQSVHSVAFRPDGGEVASGSSSSGFNSVKVWQVWRSDNIIRSYGSNRYPRQGFVAGHNSGVASVAYSPDGLFFS
jgi:WD40 repeat protein